MAHHVTISSVKRNVGMYQSKRRNISEDFNLRHNRCDKHKVVCNTVALKSSVSIYVMWNVVGYELMNIHKVCVYAGYLESKDTKAIQFFKNIY
jgi:hypothetical protein